MAVSKIENAIEKIMYASRWVLAPVYLGMSLALFALSIKFFQELFHFLPMILKVDESELFLKLLTLIDLTLVGSLTIIVVFRNGDEITCALWRRIIVWIQGAETSA